MSGPSRLAPAARPAATGAADSRRAHPPRRRTHRPAAVLRRVALGCLAGSLLVCLLTGWGDVPLWAAPLLALVVAAAEIAVQRLELGGQRWAFSLTEGALGAALVVGAGAWSVLAVAVAIAVAQTVRHAPRLKRDFDLARYVLATALAQAVTGLLGGGVAGACAGMAVFWSVGCLLVALAVSLTSPRPFRSLVVSSAPLSGLHTAGNASIGLLAAFLAREAPAGLLGLVVPLALLWSSYDQQARRSTEAKLFAELARGQERETGRSQDVSAHVVVTAAARLLGGADVELVLLAADGPVRFAGDESGGPERRRVSAGVFDEPWVLQALGDRGVRVGRDEGRPYVTAVLREGDRPLAVLRARRGRDAPAFDRNEQRLTEVLVGQAQAWLSVTELAARSCAATQRAAAADPAAPVRSDPDSAAAPALVVLRESADRLARLAERSADAEGIVDELHLVERAVASLLGARALAGEPDEPDEPGSALSLATVGAGALPPTRPGTDWTTTGVMQ